MKKLTNQELLSFNGGDNSIEDILGATCSVIGFTGGLGSTKIGVKLLLKAGVRMVPGIGQGLLIAGLACDLFW